MYCSTLVSVKVLEGAFYKEKVLLEVLLSKLRTSTRHTAPLLARDLAAVKLELIVSISIDKRGH